MLPKWHIILGFLFSLVFWFLFPQTDWTNVFLIFLASFLIDFDHYLVAVRKTGKIGLFNAFRYFDRKKKINEDLRKRRRKVISDFMFMHTIEFHLLIFILGLIYIPFIYVFIGMVFHSLLDILYMANKGVLSEREFSFFAWLGRQIRQL